MNTNLKLKEALAAQLVYWVGRSVDGVQVTVNDGMVTLGGCVPTYAEKMECEATVRRAGGVKGVANKIVVKLPESKDLGIDEIHRRAETVTPILKEIPGYLAAEAKN
ncbi:MAG TPA: BON domain-containing protein [Candidatus Sulfotelmatobacter sp.]|nr:BON domain-containing protein [Candidatus Sulfotelmatobacter sp.]